MKFECWQVESGSKRKQAANVLKRQVGFVRRSWHRWGWRKSVRLDLRSRQAVQMTRHLAEGDLDVVFCGASAPLRVQPPGGDRLDHDVDGTRTPGPFGSIEAFRWSFPENPAYPLGIRECCQGPQGPPSPGCACAGADGGSCTERPPATPADSGLLGEAWGPMRWGPGDSPRGSRWQFHPFRAPSLLCAPQWTSVDSLPWLSRPVPLVAPSHGRRSESAAATLALARFPCYSSR